MSRNILEKADWFIRGPSHVDKMADLASKRRLHEIAPQQLERLRREDLLRERDHFNQSFLYLVIKNNQLHLIPKKVLEGLDYSDWTVRDKKQKRSYFYNALVTGQRGHIPASALKKIPENEWLAGDNFGDLLVLEACLQGTFESIKDDVLPHITGKYLVNGVVDSTGRNHLYRLVGKKKLHLIPAVLLRKLSVEDWNRKDSYGVSFINYVERNQQISSVFTHDIWRGRLLEMTALWESVHVLAKNETLTNHYNQLRYKLIQDSQRQKTAKKKFNL